MTGAGFARRDAAYNADILSTANSAADCADHPAGLARDGGRDAGTSTSCPPSISNRSFASTQATTEFLESVRLLTAGGVAGAVSKTATAPLARLTILYQVNGLDAVVGSGGRVGLLQAFQQVIRREGMLALWRGNGVTIVHRLPYSAVNFWAYERATQMWAQRFPPGQAPGTWASSDMLRRLVSGGVAGITACTLAYPLDLVRTRLSAQTKTQYYRGIGHALATIVRDEGARGLYRGLGATLAQVAPSLAINYTAYGTLRSHWLQRYGGDAHTVVMSLVCGGSAGLISSTLTFPLDLIRRRMQLEGQAGTRRYKGYMDVARSVMADGGLRGFYAGILPEYYKVIPGVAIGYCTYEFMRKALGVQTNPGSER